MAQPAGPREYGERLVVVYNTLWEEPWETPAQVPDHYVFSTDRGRIDQADAVIFHLPSLENSFAPGLCPRKREQQLWVAWSMECELHYPQMRSEAFMRHFDLQMTYKQTADAWVPYLPADFADHLSIPIPFAQRQSVPCCAFISSRFNQSKRLELLHALMKEINIDSYGKVANNRQEPNDDGPAFKRRTIAGYKFTLAFENALGEDYVTEKFFDPLLAGSVPVYLGAPNIHCFAPNERCFINASDFDSPQALASHLQNVANDRTEYERLLAWRNQPLTDAFLSLLGQVQRHPVIRLCEALEKLLMQRSHSAQAMPE